MYDSDELRALAVAAQGHDISAILDLRQEMTPNTVLYLLDEIERLRKDTERYQWLRRRAVMMDYSDEVSITLTLFKDEGPTGEFLDDQVDTAMTQGGGA